ncbi:MAG TPA: hypothetical protein VMV92_17770 [Streptosporangiaceae bacterium]|nr:hypothetical protein [Streptosporangiaceae bacterium]
MRIGRAIIIPAMFALGVAGAALSGPTLPAVAGHPASVIVKSVPAAVTAASAACPAIMYNSCTAMMYN